MWSKAPEPAVIAVVTVVAHHEEMVGWNFHRRQAVTLIHCPRVRVYSIWFIQFAPIDVDGPIANFNCLSGQTYNAFDQPHLWILRRPKRHNVTTMNGSGGQVALHEFRIISREGDFIYKEMIPNENRRSHRL